MKSAKTRLVKEGLRRFPTAAFALSARRQKKTVVKFLFISVLVIDQLSKYIVGQKIPLGKSVPVIEHIFHLTHILNRGGAFGILKNQIYFFIISAVMAIILILVNLRRKKTRCVEIALYLILGGAISNLIDRVRLGAVIDFLDFRVWPVFNVADSAITIGAILLLYSILFIKVDKTVYHINTKPQRET